MQKEEKRIFIAVILTIIILISGITAVSYICRYDNDTEHFSKITIGDARDIALEDAKTKDENVVFTRQEREREHGTYAYEIEFNDGLTRYKYVIDSQTGEIITRFSTKIS